MNTPLALSKIVRVRTAAALLVGALMAGALPAAPAQAGGTVGLTLTPQSRDAERALRAGLAIYGIANDIRASGSIRQFGRDNRAGLAQDGRGHLGIVHQEGRGHTGTLTQTGRSNAHGLFQFGRGANADIRQDGVGRSGVTVQFGF